MLYGGMFSNHEDHAERTTHDQRDAREWVSVCTGMGEWRMEYHICVWGGGGGGGGGVLFIFGGDVGGSMGQPTILNNWTITKECSAFDLQTGEWVTERNRNDNMRMDEWRNEIG